MGTRGQRLTSGYSGYSAATGLALWLTLWRDELESISEWKKSEVKDYTYWKITRMDRLIEAHRQDLKRGLVGVLTGW